MDPAGLSKTKALMWLIRPKAIKLMAPAGMLAIQHRQAEGQQEGIETPNPWDGTASMAHADYLLQRLRAVTLTNQTYGVSLIPKLPDLLYEINIHMGGLHKQRPRDHRNMSLPCIDTEMYRSWQEDRIVLLAYQPTILEEGFIRIDHQPDGGLVNLVNPEVGVLHGVIFLNTFEVFIASRRAPPTQVSHASSHQGLLSNEQHRRSELTEWTDQEAHVPQTCDPTALEKSGYKQNAAAYQHANAIALSQVKHQGLPVCGDHGEKVVEDAKETHRRNNNLAAAKCRAKKRKCVSEAESKLRELEISNTAMKKQVRDLRDEFASLRMHALRHHECSLAIASYNLVQAERAAGGRGSRVFSFPQMHAI